MCSKIIILLSALFLCAFCKITELEYVSIPDLFHIDDFDRCLMLGDNALYCSVQMQLAPIPATDSEAWKIIQKLISNRKNYRHDWLRYRICVPISCPNMTKNVSSYMNDMQMLQEEISKCYSLKLKHFGLSTSVTKIECETNKPVYEIDGYDIAIGIFLIMLVLVVLFSSFYEGRARYKSKEHYNQIMSTKHGRIIACFSIPKNWERLKAENTSPDAKAFRFVNGMRFYTIFLVMMVHACMVGFILFPSNPQFAETMTEDPVNMLFINGNYCIQIFLIMSSWLLSHHFFVTFEKQQTIKITYILYAFIHRYIRLTTCLAVVIAIHASWLQHLDRGPFWDRVVGEEYRNCRKNWWTNLLYINNYYDTENMCLLQTWYLAVDTQLFVYSLIILALVWKYKKFLVWIFSTSLAIGILLPGIVNYINGYDIVLRQYPETLFNLFAGIPEWTQIMIPSHTNLGACTIGLIAGYIFYKTKNKKIITKKHQVALWWVITWVLPLSVIFVGILLYDDDYVPSRLGAAIYVALAKSLYAIGLTVGIYGISQNVGWLLRDAVVTPPLQFLGRLTYCVFLVHTAIIRIRSGQSRSKAYMTIYTFLYQTCGDLILSHIFALVLCLFVELPTSALQRLMMPKLKKETAELTNHKNTEDPEIGKNGDIEVSKM